MVTNLISTLGIPASCSKISDIQGKQDLVSRGQTLFHVGGAGIAVITPGEI